MGKFKSKHLHESELPPPPTHFSRLFLAILSLQYFGQLRQSGCLDRYWASLPNMPKLTPSWLFKGRACQSGCLDGYLASLPSRLKLTPSWLFKKRTRLSLYGWVPNIRGRELPLRSGKCNMQVSHANMSTCFQHTQVQIYVQFQRCGVDIRSYLVRNGSRRCPFPTSTLPEPLNRKTQTNAFIIQYNISIQHKFLESTLRFDQMTNANRGKQGLPSTRVRRDAVGWCPHPCHIMPR